MAGNGMIVTPHFSTEHALADEGMFRAEMYKCDLPASLLLWSSVRMLSKAVFGCVIGRRASLHLCGSASVFSCSLPCCPSPR